jgi:hypothetical protein
MTFIPIRTKTSTLIGVFDEFRNYILRKQRFEFLPTSEKITNFMAGWFLEWADHKHMHFKAAYIPL